MNEGEKMYNSNKFIYRGEVKEIGQVIKEAKNFATQ